MIYFIFLLIVIIILKIQSWMLRIILNKYAIYFLIASIAFIFVKFLLANWLILIGVTILGFLLYNFTAGFFEEIRSN
ncbi:hypothetical protein RD055328_08200 [Companilactobacillus sp. RD055328]|nr:hypothetical protein RD055328_08200 [Companilactobacillus sp. RD055328]